MSYRTPGEREAENPQPIYSYADAVRARDRRFGGPWGQFALLCAAMVLNVAVQIAFGLSGGMLLAQALFAFAAFERWLRATGRSPLFPGDDAGKR